VPRLSSSNPLREAARIAINGTPRSARGVRILFLHRSVAAVERCLRELRSVRWAVAATRVSSSRQLLRRLAHAESPDAASPGRYDLVIAGHPSPQWRAIRQCLSQVRTHIPVIIVTEAADSRLAELAEPGGADWIEMDRLARLPDMARHALDEHALRGARDRAERRLRHSEACLQALTDNPAYGVARCGPDGTIFEANRALATMLGYASGQELLAEAGAVAGRAPAASATLGPLPFPARGVVEPAELCWKRKDGTDVVVRCSGSAIPAAGGAPGGYQIIAQDITAQRALVAELRRFATADALTGLANYRQFAEVLERELQRSKRTGRELAVLLLDLDGLKRINDRYGHLAGNSVLCRLAKVLTFFCRCTDTAARFGGDEFAIVAPETGAAAARLLAARIRAHCASQSESPRLSVGIGVAAYPPDGASVDTLLLAADRALYQVKRRSRPVALTALPRRHAHLFLVPQPK
jgi:diguanylate cyclase (GGDEF)-like protein